VRVTLTRLELGALTAADTLQFVHDLAIGTEASATDTLAQWLYGETGGQPLFVVETLRALLERKLLLPHVRADRRWGIELSARWPDAPGLSSMLPPRVRDVIHGRLSHLAPATRELLSAGSVLGQGFTFEQLCRVAGLNEHEALTATVEVLQVNVVREAGIGDGRTQAGGYVFAHDKIRDVVYAESGEARRRVFHRRALDALHSNGHAALLAHHALAGGLDEPAVRFSRAAGDEAVDLLAARDAIVH
jgi:predicted ATPase